MAWKDLLRREVPKTKKEKEKGNNRLLSKLFNSLKPEQIDRFIGPRFRSWMPVYRSELPCLKSGIGRKWSLSVDPEPWKAPLEASEQGRCSFLKAPCTAVASLTRRANGFRAGSCGPLPGSRASFSVPFDILNVLSRIGSHTSESVKWGVLEGFSGSGQDEGWVGGGGGGVNVKRDKLPLCR